MKFSFLGMGQESPPLQIYGKLPIAKDYLRIACGDGAGRDLREWLDRTFGTTRDESDELVLGEPLRFFGMDEKEPLQGCLWPSSDAGEHRRFPFTVFVGRRRKALLADLDEGNLSQAESVWRVLSEKRVRCTAATDGQAMLDEQRGQDIEVDAVEDVSVAAADFDSWIAALWGDEGLDGLNELLERVRALGRERHGGPVRLPLARALPIRDQVIGWVFVLRAVGVLEEGEIPTLFFPPRAIVRSYEPAQLVVCSRALRDDEVRWITAGPDEDLGPADLAAGFRSDDSDEPPPDCDVWLREPLMEALGSPGAGEG